MSIMSYDLAVWEGRRSRNGDAAGPIVPLYFRSDGAADAAEFAAELAEEHGLVCYDPQAEMLLP